MPTADRSGDHPIDERLEALAAERRELRASLKNGDLEQADFTRAMTKNEFLVTQLKEQRDGAVERSAERDREKARERKRDFFGD